MKRILASAAEEKSIRRLTIEPSQIEVNVANIGKIGVSAVARGRENYAGDSKMSQPYRIVGCPPQALPADERIAHILRRRHNWKGEADTGDVAGHCSICNASVWVRKAQQQALGEDWIVVCLTCLIEAGYLP